MVISRVLDTFFDILETFCVNQVNVKGVDSSSHVQINISVRRTIISSINIQRIHKGEVLFFFIVQLSDYEEL